MLATGIIAVKTKKKSKILEVRLTLSKTWFRQFPFENMFRNLSTAAVN
jgi:hypothetical protein